jgi:flagellar biosynthesis protein FliR
MQQLTLNNLTAFAAVFTRMGAMVFLNPVFSRRNVPSQVRAGLALFLTILLVVHGGYVASGKPRRVVILVILFRELLVGWLARLCFKASTTFFSLPGFDGLSVWAFHGKSF